MEEDVTDLRTPEFWKAVYAVLVKHAGAYNGPHNADDFAQAFMDSMTREYRCCGRFGFGGKFRRNADKIYVDCYQEDETPKIKRQIAKVNKILAGMRETTPGVPSR